MICFHSLNYWYLPQLYSQMFPFNVCCDLLSFFELLIFTTTYLNKYHYQNSCDLLSFFELLIFTTTQKTGLLRFGCCDLLSFFELLIFTTTLFLSGKNEPVLWFAFILWITDIYHNKSEKDILPCSVVICFHSLNYWYLPQQQQQQGIWQASCDLLSFFELLIFTTTYQHVVNWISKH